MTTKPAYAMTLDALRAMRADGSFDHATYRERGSIWEGLYIYGRDPKGFRGYSLVGCFPKDDPELDAAFNMVRGTGCCEHEWPTDTGRQVCPECGNDGNIEGHVIRDEANSRGCTRDGQRARSRPLTAPRFPSRASERAPREGREGIEPVPNKRNRYRSWFCVPLKEWHVYYLDAIGNDHLICRAADRGWARAIAKELNKRDGCPVW